MDLGLVFASTEGLQGFAPVLSRVQMGERAAISELIVAAAFVRLGYRPTLEPEIRGRKPDFSIAIHESNLVLFEVVTPETSQLMRRLSEELIEAANCLRATVPGACVSVVFVAEPETRAREIVSAAVRKLGIPDEGENVAEIPDLAHIRIRRFTPQATSFEPFSPRPDVALGAASFQFNPDGTGTRVNALIAFTDERADRFLEGEARHFAREACNVLVMDLSAVPGGMNGWRPLLERRFQPTLNRRFSAVILFQTSVEGIARKWVVIPNPYAYTALPNSLVLRLDGLH